MCECIDGLLLIGVRAAVLLDFVLDRPPGFEIFWETESKQYEPFFKSVLNKKKHFIWKFMSCARLISKTKLLPLLYYQSTHGSALTTNLSFHVV